MKKYDNVLVPHRAILLQKSIHELQFESSQLGPVARGVSWSEGGREGGREAWDCGEY